MQNKAILRILVLVLGVAGVSCSSLLGNKVYEQREIANETFKMRITASIEPDMFLPGAYLVLQTTSIGSNEWRDLVTMNADDPIPVKPEQLNFVTSHVGYGVLGPYYVVTTNGGNDWSIWNGDSQLNEYKAKYNLTGYIEEVQIQPDGTGRMRIHRFFDEGERGPDLLTTDYGVHWSFN